MLPDRIAGHLRNPLLDLKTNDLSLNHLIPIVNICHTYQYLKYCVARDRISGHLKNPVLDLQNNDLSLSHLIPIVNI